MIFSTNTQSGNVIFILLYRTLDPLFSTVLGLPLWGSSKGKIKHNLLKICINKNTSFTKMFLLKSLNAQTDHDVRLNKLRQKKSMTSNLIPSSVIYMEILCKMRFCCKIENLAKSAQIWPQRVPLVLTKNKYPHFMFLIMNNEVIWSLKSLNHVSCPPSLLNVS